MSLSNSHFKECFGDLSEEEQNRLKAILFLMTENINKELETKPFKNVYGELNFIKLSQLNLNGGDK